MFTFDESVESISIVCVFGYRRIGLCWIGEPLFYTYTSWHLSTAFNDFNRFLNELVKNDDVIFSFNFIACIVVMFIYILYLTSNRLPGQIMKIHKVNEKVKNIITSTYLHRGER